MMQALKRPEYDDDDDFSMGEEEDISPDYLTYRRPAPAPRPRGTSGPGKRGGPFCTSWFLKAKSELICLGVLVKGWMRKRIRIKGKYEMDVLCQKEGIWLFGLVFHYY